MSKYCIACYNTPEDCTCYPNRKPKDNQGDWEEEKNDNPLYAWLNSKAERLSVLTDLQSLIRELLKKQKEEIIVKAEGYRNSYDALGKFIEDLSNS